MTRAAAKPKRKPLAGKRGADAAAPERAALATAAAATPATATPATATAATPTQERRERREYASAPERVDRRKDEMLVLKAVHESRPGTSRGPASPLWKDRREGGLGMGGVYEAAQLYLIDHLSAEQVRRRVGLPQAKARALDRLLYKIQEEHTRLLSKDLEARLVAEQLAPIEGDVVGLGLQFASGLIKATMPDVAVMKWGEMDQTERHTTLRLAEWISDIVKSASTAQHKEAQTERLERMLRRELEDAAAKGQTSVPTDRLRALFAVEMGLAPAEGGGA